MNHINGIKSDNRLIGHGAELKIQFLSGVVTEALSIGQMQAELPEQLRVYFEIVRAFKDGGGVIPYDSMYAFTENWQGIEVAPLFMEKVGST